MLRPWSGQTEDNRDDDIPNDPKNPLYPGAIRGNNQVRI